MISMRWQMWTWSGGDNHSCTPMSFFLEYVILLHYSILHTFHWKVSSRLLIDDASQKNKKSVFFISGKVSFVSGKWVVMQAFPRWRHVFRQLTGLLGYCSIYSTSLSSTCLALPFFDVHLRPLTSELPGPMTMHFRNKRNKIKSWVFLLEGLFPIWERWVVINPLDGFQERSNY